MILPKSHLEVSSMHIASTEEKLLFMEAGLQAKNIEVILGASSSGVFRWGDFCGRIADLDLPNVIKVLNQNAHCLEEVVRRRGLIHFQPVSAAKSDRALTISKMKDFTRLEVIELANVLIIDEVGDAERSLYEVLKGDSNVDPFFLAQFGVIEDVGNFPGRNILVAQQILRESKAIKPHIWRLGRAIIDRATKDRHRDFEYSMKLIHLLFEDFPAALEDDNEMLSYVEYLVRKIEHTKETSDCILGNEVDYMTDHLTHIFQHRVVDYKLLEEKYGDYYRALFKKYMVAGTMLNIQLATSKEELKQSVDLYFQASARFHAETVTNLLSCLKDQDAQLVILHSFESHVDKWLKEDSDSMEEFVKGLTVQNPAVQEWQARVVAKLHPQDIKVKPPTSNEDQKKEEADKGSSTSDNSSGSSTGGSSSGSSSSSSGSSGSSGSSSSSGSSGSSSSRLTAKEQSSAASSLAPKLALWMALLGALCL